jgi:glutathione S-transferase
MKLYGSFTSPFARHCRLVLSQSGLDWQFVEIDGTQSAELSPTKKVPFLVDGHIQLSDSSAILKYIREKNEQSFLADTEQFDVYCLINTIMDATINVFYLENEGTSSDENIYIQRQTTRINDGLKHIEKLLVKARINDADAVLRLACFLDWGIFRNRFSIETFTHLRAFLAVYDNDPFFKATHPSISK